jgi:hypothetical protein
MYRKNYIFIDVLIIIIIISSSSSNSSSGGGRCSSSSSSSSSIEFQKFNQDFYFIFSDNLFIHHLKPITVDTNIS